MQKFDLILNVHGELPGATTLKAEAEYTPVIRRIHAAFPSLRIVLEHISTREGLETVRQCGPTVRYTRCRLVCEKTLSLIEA